jgi:WD40 repeat protein
VDVLAWASQGLVVVSCTGTMYRWQPGDREARFFSTECDGDAAWSRQGLAVVDEHLVSFVSNDLVIHRRDDEGESQRLRGHTNVISGVVPMPGGRVLTWADDGTLRSWDMRARRAERVLAGHRGSITGAVATEDGGVVSWGSDRTARRWSAAGESVAVCEHPRGVRRALSLSDDGLAALADDGVRAWTAAGASRFWPLARPLDLKAAGDQLVAIAAEDPAVYLMTPSSGASRRIEGHAGAVLGTAPMADGRHLLSWSTDGRVLRWHIVVGPA